MGNNVAIVRRQRPRRRDFSRASTCTIRCAPPPSWSRTGGGCTIDPCERSFPSREDHQRALLSLQLASIEFSKTPPARRARRFDRACCRDVIGASFTFHLTFIARSYPAWSSAKRFAESRTACWLILANGINLWSSISSEDVTSVRASLRSSHVSSRANSFPSREGASSSFPLLVLVTVYRWHRSRRQEAKAAQRKSHGDRTRRCERRARSLTIANKDASSSRHARARARIESKPFAIDLERGTREIVPSPTLRRLSLPRREIISRERFVPREGRIVFGGVAVARIIIFRARADRRWTRRNISDLD